MNTSLQNGGVYTDLHGLQGIKRLGKRDRDAALWEVSRQFEGLFFKMVLKSMRDATVESGLFDSNQSKQYREMFDHQLSVTLGQSGKLGIANMIYRQLGGKKGTGKPMDAVTKAPVARPLTKLVVASQDKRMAGTGKSVSNAARDGKLSMFSSPLAFIRAIYPHAKRAAERLGVSPRVLLAQAALETGWGKKVITGADGKGHSYFGIKAGSGWQGASSRVPTLEYRHGVVQREKASFRIYDDPRKAFDDYVNFLRSSKRYQGALRSRGDDHAFIDGLARAGYATDPAYAAKIRRIMAGKTLNGILSKLGIETG